MTDEDAIAEQLKLLNSRLATYNAIMAESLYRQYQEHYDDQEEDADGPIYLLTMLETRWKPAMARFQLAMDPTAEDDSPEE